MRSNKDLLTEFSERHLSNEEILEDAAPRSEAPPRPAILHVTYHLSTRGPQDYPSLLAAIKEFDHHQLSNSSWVVATLKSEQAILELLEAHLGAGDYASVSTLFRPPVGRFFDGANAWFKEHALSFAQWNIIAAR